MRPRQGARSRQVKYRSHLGGVLTPSRHPAAGQCQGVSLTGAVSSQTVTEEFEGTLSAVGNRAIERKGRSVPHCETDTSSRRESGT